MIIREDSGDIAIVRLAHGKVSALDAELCECVVQELTAIAASRSRALILTGTGHAFSAGVDLFRLLKEGQPYLDRFLPAMDALFRTLLTFPKPTVAAVNGHAIAGGCILACACDYRVMTEDAGTIGIPELRVGVPFPILPFEIVRARLTPSIFRQLVMTGSVVGPDEARSVGLVDELAPADVLLVRAEHAAEQLAGIPPMTFTLTRRAFVDPLLQRARDAAAINDDVAAAWASEPIRERIRAYLERTVGRK